jgi:autotransporter-associated beta strand protein
MTLADASTYSGRTAVGAGTLLVTNTIGSATGAGPVNIQHRDARRWWDDCGDGMCRHRQRVWRVPGTGSWLNDAGHAHHPKRAHVQYRCDLHLHLQSEAEQVQERQGDCQRSHHQQRGDDRPKRPDPGKFETGLVLTLISNTSANRITGTFRNLPDGGIVTINGNNFQAGYSGGD